MASINIGNTSYSVEDEWLKVAVQYFNIDPDSETSVNLLKAGLFGYNNEIQSNEIKNNVYHRNVLYDEHFLNTASFPESIANFAKLNNVAIDLANPSHMRVTMSIRKLDLLNSPFKEEIIMGGDSSINGISRKVFAFTLSDQFEFDIEGIPFKLPYPVQFIMKELENSKDYSITARYDVNDDFPYMNNMSNPYLKVWNENIESTDYIFIGLDLFQLYRSTSTFAITSNDVRENVYLNKEFVDQLAYVEVYYLYNGTETKIPVYQNNHYLSNNDAEDYCYFTVVDENTVQISFASDANAFRPRMNSEIRVTTYSTKGKFGNFSYTGEIRVNFNNQNEFDKLPVKITPITDAKGGYNKLTTSEIKKKVIEEVLGRRNIITDTDLEFFFNNFNSDNSINDSRVSFYKKRHDVLKRLITGYILLRDIDGNIAPTNTAPHLLISEDYFKDPFGKLSEGLSVDDDKGMIVENTPVLYDRVNDKFFLFNEKQISALGEENFIIDKTKQDGLDIYLNAFEGVIGYKTKESNGYYRDHQYRVYNNRLQKREVIYTITGNTEVVQSVGDWGGAQSVDTRVAGTRMTYRVSTYNNIIAMGHSNYDASNPDVELLNVYDVTRTSFKIGSAFMSDPNFILYTIPYVIKLLEDPIYKSKYYKTSVFKGYSTKFENINSLVDTNFLINSIEISKEPNFNYTYFMNIALNTNMSLEELDDKVKIRCIVRDDGVELGYIDFRRIEGTYEYVGSLATDNDTITDDGKIKIIQSLKGMYNNLPIENGIVLSEKIDISMAVLYKDPNTDYKYGSFDKMNDLDEYATAVVYTTDDKIQLFKNLDKYVESDLVVSSKEITLNTENRDIKFIGLERYSDSIENIVGEDIRVGIMKEEEYIEDLTGIVSEIESNIVINLSEQSEGLYNVAIETDFCRKEYEYEKTVDGNILFFKSSEVYYDDVQLVKGTKRYFDLRQVPLVEYEYYQSKFTEVLDTLDIYDDIILDIVDRLENNDSLDIKFYNTYGASKYWVTDTNGLEFKDENFDYVDVCAIGLEFTIYTSQIVSDEDDRVIKKFISDFVESCNESGLFAISNLLRVMEENFEFIRYIEFGHVAGEETQKIFNNFDNFVNMSSQEINDFVPEYLNIKKAITEQYLTDSVTGGVSGVYEGYIYDISVNYK